MYRKSYEVTGYTFDADCYCVMCTLLRFVNPDYAEDTEGNTISAIFLGDETDHMLCCGNCGEEIETNVIGARW